jgi:hypothetical protein
MERFEMLPEAVKMLRTIPDASSTTKRSGGMRRETGRVRLPALARLLMFNARFQHLGDPGIHAFAGRGGGHGDTAMEFRGHANVEPLKRLARLLSKLGAGRNR